MEATYLLICIDGLDPEYVRHASTPTLDHLAQQGGTYEVSAVVPTVTNVNNVSIVTGAYPNKHGITSNFYRDRKAGVDRYMEHPEDVLCETIFESAGRCGVRSALLTVKDKLRSLIGRGATVGVSAESPPACLLEELGPPPDVYDITVNLWLMDALRLLLRSPDAPQYIYYSTTDYPMHKYAPHEEAAMWHLTELDRRLGQVLDEVPGPMMVAVTADHGMNQKHIGWDLARLLGRHGVRGEVIPIIKDRYEVHHQNLGGAAYIYLTEPKQLEAANVILASCPGVEAVLTADQAADTYHLHRERIGDLLALGRREAAFGSFCRESEEINVRSHGSLHERRIPMILFGKGRPNIAPQENKDAVVWLTADWPEGPFPKHPS